MVDPTKQRENSMLTFESSQSLGAASVLEKLVVRHGQRPGEADPGLAKSFRRTSLSRRSSTASAPSMRSPPPTAASSSW